MMKRFLTLLALCILVASPAMAEKTYDFETPRGIRVSVQACTDNIFRIRVSPRSQYTESLMERYGIVKSDWQQVATSFSSGGGLYTISTSTCKLVVDENTESVYILKDGRKVVQGISFIPAGSKACLDLAAVINDKFAGMHVASNGSIIGDDDGSISEKDKAESGDPAKSCVVSFKLADDERFYGGGSTSREHIQHRGELLRMHTTYQHTEIPMPFVMSSAGWGVFNNTTRKNFFDIGCTQPDKFNIYTPYDEVDVFLFVGDSMPDVLDSYTLVTGRPYVLPKWAYGLCFGPNMREDQWDILSDAVNFRRSDVPWWSWWWWFPWWSSWSLFPWWSSWWWFPWWSW